VAWYSYTVVCCRDGDQQLEILDALEPLAEWLDSEEAVPIYAKSVRAQRAKFDNPELTPSARMIEEIKTTGSFFEHAQKYSKQHDAWLKEQSIDDELNEKIASDVQASIAKQAEMELTSTGEFSNFLADYLGQIRVKQTR